MLNDIDFDKIDINGSIPEDETDRQYYYIAQCREHVTNLKKVIGRDLTCSVKTFGCQMNARDSEKILGMLILMGYTPIESEDADLDEGRASTYFVENGSYAKLRTLQIGYNMPERYLKKLNMSRARFYISGNNLLTIKSSDLTCSDPENPNWAYPNSTSLSFGLQLGF